MKLIALFLVSWDLDVLRHGVENFKFVDECNHQAIQRSIRFCVTKAKCTNSYVRKHNNGIIIITNNLNCLITIFDAVLRKTTNVIRPCSVYHSDFQ